MHIAYGWTIMVPPIRLFGWEEGVDPASYGLTVETTTRTETDDHIQ